MSSEQEQIILSYEQLGMTPLEIAEDRDLKPETVKAALLAGSVKYRKDCGASAETPAVVENGKDFTDEQFDRVKQRIYDIAIGSDNDLISLKAAIYVHEDKRGRHDVARALGGNGFDVLKFNEAMKRVDELVYGRMKVIEMAK